MDEEWRSINMYEGKYEISSLGRVRSISSSRGKILKQGINKGGYLHVGLFHKGFASTQKIHRLVAIAFLPNSNFYIAVNHVDGDKKNNCVSNLEWCTNSENTIHAFKIGLMKGLKGSNNPMSKLTEVEVREIRLLYSTNKFTLLELGSRYNVKYNTISRIINYKVYKDV